MWEATVNNFLEEQMEVIYECCCGLDVHKDKMVACLVQKSKKEIRTYGGTTDELLQLTAWLKKAHCEMVAMESTGSYWKPVFNLLEAEELPAMVVNAQHIKAVPGRKTDIKDSEWIADLLRHGLLRASFIPNRDQRELRELVRYRGSLIEERAREYNRLQKILTGANIKLASVTTIDTESARDMLNAMIAGVEDVVVLANMAKGVLRKKIPQLQTALKGLIGPHQKMILRCMLSHIDSLSVQISILDAEINDRLSECQREIELLETIIGVGKRSAQVIVSEIGTDMDRFPDENHLASWAGLTPGNNESAGKKKSGKTRKGNPTFKKTLVQCAKSASHTQSYFSAQYRRIASRRGRNRATVAVAHSMAIAAYHILKNKEEFKDLGSDYFDKTRRDIIIKQTVKRLERLGLNVTIEESPPQTNQAVS
jgi:transposase